ncbi:MAG: Na(+)/H(+) antiporter subunit B [Candidatus Izemoplasmatales bacterium]|nr:Na(+)/H(+) antiporter subunit B [Candidatus Izemoplasmatales bacterium]
MKNLLAFLLTIGLGVLIIFSLSSNTLFPAFGSVDVSDRVSNSYIDKNVLDPANTETIIFGETTDPESGAANIVTSIVVDYRSFDTLGEVTVLFISALGVALLLGSAPKQKRLALDFKPNFMLRVGSRALFGIILMTGVYVTLHGHLTPGGGFPGGAMIASSILLLYLADDQFRAKIKGIKTLESIAGSLYVILGLLGLVVGTYFLQNFLPNGTVGDLLSSGIIPIVYILIGLKVGSEISGVIDNFLTEEETI